MGRRYGAILGTVALAAVALQGLVHQSPLSETLANGLAALLVFTLLGSLLGWAGALVVRDAVRWRQAQQQRNQPPQAATG